ncbi:MAG: sulfite exporter TauE/SafE family protein [Negativicutes bacterium]|nr:sulfite exporter TauE/SafE family protein [Negativicutes bacterium]
MEMIQLLQGALIGSIGGTLAGLLGVGGGFIMVPLLVMIMGLGQQMAQGISLLVIVPTSIVAIWRLHKSSLIDWSMVMVMAVGSILGAAISSNFVQYIDSKLLTKIFGFCVILVGLKMYFDARKNEQKNSAEK